MGTRLESRFDNKKVQIFMYMMFRRQEANLARSPTAHVSQAKKLSTIPPVTELHVLELFWTWNRSQPRSYHAGTPRLEFPDFARWLAQRKQVHSYEDLCIAFFKPEYFIGKCFQESKRLHRSGAYIGQWNYWRPTRKWGHFRGAPDFP